MQIKNYFYLLFTLSLLVSCETDDNGGPTPNNSGAYSNGFFVLNEGLWGQGNSSISFVDPGSQKVSHGIFSEVNGTELGDTATDIEFFGDLAFVVVNVSNKIEVVDRSTFSTVATIDSDLNNPRQIAFLEGMAYVSNWGEGSDPDDDYIAVFNAETFELETKIAVEEGPEALLSQGEKIFVAHKGGWSFNNKISVISGNEVEKLIEVGIVPNSLSADGSYLWVSTAGMPDWAGETAGSISRIDLSTLEVVKTYGNASASWHPSNMVVENGKVYYTVGREVYSFGAGEESLPSEAIFEMEEVDNLYGFKFHGEKIYAASANADFTGDGEVHIYNATTGNLEASYDTGINPNGIFFQE